jgi:hypothetical protein
VVHHVSLEIPPPEVARTVELWRALGFAEVEAPGPINPYVTWLERGGTQVHLIHTEEARVPALGHVAVVADGFDATIKRLREAEFEVEDARPLWDERRAFVIGPAGHRVELMEAPPPPA